MKKIAISLMIIFVLILVPITVFAAGSIAPSPRSLTITEGGSSAFTITASNAAGRVNISSSNSAVASVSTSSVWVENGSSKVTVTGKSAGTATITVSLYDAATFDEEELTGSYTISVTVKAAQSDSAGTNNNTNQNANNNNTQSNTNTTNKVQSNLSKNNKLKELSVEGYDLIEKGNNTYELSVTNNIDNVNIKATAEDAKATVSGYGNKKLEIGLNKFEIVVKAESGAKNTYVINVTRKDNIYLEDLKNVIGNIESKDISVVIDKDSKITKEDIEKIKEHQKTIKFDYINEENKTMYSWIIAGAEINGVSDINTKINLTSDYIEQIENLSNYAEGFYMNFENIGEFPKGVKVKIYVEDKFKEGTVLNLYNYNKENNTLEKTKNDVTVKEGYIELDLEKASNYFLTRAEIVKVSPIKNKEINIYMIIAIIEFLIIIIIAILKIIKKVKNK